MSATDEPATGYGDHLGPTQGAIQRQERADRMLSLSRAVLAVLVGALILVVITLLVIVTLQTRGITASVESCILPGGDCYERGVEGERQRALNLEQAETNGEALERVLAILRMEYPEAYNAVVETGAVTPTSPAPSPTP